MQKGKKGGGGSDTQGRKKKKKTKGPTHNIAKDNKKKIREIFQVHPNSFIPQVCLCSRVVTRQSLMGEMTGTS